MLKKLTGVGIALLGAMLAAQPAQAQPRERSGVEIVKAQCASCHEKGVNGAPKIDDRAAWIPRMKNGVDATVRSAARGHGAMPVRGGMSDLTDAELRAAILYMFYPAAASLQGTAAPAAAPDPNHKAVAGMDVYLGVAPAKGRGSYHINIALRDAGTKAGIGDAAVEARVSNPLGGASKRLAPTTVNNAVSYANDFTMSGNQPYTIAVQIRRPASAPPVEARFEFKP